MIACPFCNGCGAMLENITSKIQTSAPAVKQVLCLCAECKGLGLVEPGFLAKREGLLDKKE